MPPPCLLCRRPPPSSVAPRTREPAKIRSVVRACRLPTVALSLAHFCARLLLRQAWGLSVDVLVTKGLSRNTIEALHSRGLVNVEDLKDLDSAGIASMPLDQHEKAALRQIAEEVTEEAARARGEVPVKNTFIDVSA